MNKIQKGIRLGIAGALLLIIIFIVQIIPWEEEPISTKEVEITMIDPPESKEVPKNPEQTEVTTVDLLGHIVPRLDLEIAEIIAREIDINAKKYSLPPGLIIAIIKKESVFNVLATSKSEAVGLMQIYPEAHPEKIDGYSLEQLYHIGINISIGCSIFKEYYVATGSVTEALKKYVGGHVEGYVEDICMTFMELVMWQEKL